MPRSALHGLSLGCQWVVSGLSLGVLGADGQGFKVGFGVGVRWAPHGLDSRGFLIKRYHILPKI